MAFITQGILEGIRTLKDGSISFNISTLELDGDKAADLFKLRNKNMIVALSEKGFSEDAINELDKVKVEVPKPAGKSKSQLLRNVLYRLWEASPNGFDNSDDHYNHFMDNIIELYKGKIE